MAIKSIPNFTEGKSSTNPSTWNKKKDKWFVKGDWLNGWPVLPNVSVNREAFADSYLKNKERWDKAFTFLKNSDLSKLELKRNDIDGDILYSTVSEYVTKNEETDMFEAHRKYIDIQYLISGKEIINIAPISSVKEILTAYDPIRDIEFMTVNHSHSYIATQDSFFILFPNDAHQPCIKSGGYEVVKKVVIKVRID